MPTPTPTKGAELRGCAQKALLLKAKQENLPRDSDAPLLNIPDHLAAMARAGRVTWGEHGGDPEVKGLGAPKPQCTFAHTSTAY